jgi:hypothetical protein
VILTTTDGGFIWKESTINPHATIGMSEAYVMSFPTASVGYVAGSNGEGTDRTGPILKSVDGGATWNFIDNVPYSIYGMSFVNAHSGTTVGLNGLTSHTSDGGASWVEVNSGTTVNLTAVHHSGLQNAFGVGAKTAIIRLTTNDTIVTLSAPRTPVSKKHDMLRSVYPNPASELATFEIAIESTTTLSLSLFDVKGNRVASIFSGVLPNGVHEANVDVSELAAGIYFARLDTPDGSEIIKVIVQ